MFWGHTTDEGAKWAILTPPSTRAALQVKWLSFLTFPNQGPEAVAELPLSQSNFKLRLAKLLKHILGLGVEKLCAGVISLKSSYDPIFLPTKTLNDFSH